MRNYIRTAAALDGEGAKREIKQAATWDLQDKVFEGLDFAYCQTEGGECYKGKDGFFYTITDFGGGEYVIEYTESKQNAKNNVFWDADWFSGDPGAVIPKMRAALLEYVGQSPTKGTEKETKRKS